MAAYYNEIDPFAAQWLRNLIAGGLIAPGGVDERSIEDVAPDDLRGYEQCHFFAGIGGWGYALRLAGWPDDRPVWTGSCPCQPFSAAGKGGGFADERHLWPAFFHLIGERRPAVVFGEQVASKDGLAWLDLVQADLEGEGYAVAAVDLCAAGVGAPNIRQRLLWVADSYGKRRDRERVRLQPRGRNEARSEASWGGEAGGLEHAAIDGRAERRPEPSGWGAAGGCGDGRLAGAHCEQQRGLDHGQGTPSRCHEEEVGEQNRKRLWFVDDRGGAAAQGWPGPAHVDWRDADWLYCRDGKWRPVEPGSSPLAHGIPRDMGKGRPRVERLAIRAARACRVGSLRGYGNAINAEAARLFVEAYLEAELFA